MNIIKVDTSKLRSAANEFNTTSAAIRSMTNNMTNTVNQLSGAAWTGEAASAYVTRFNGLQDEIDKIDAMIKEHVSDLLLMADEYDSAEATNMQISSSLKSDIF